MLPCADVDSGRSARKRLLRLVNQSLDEDGDREDREAVDAGTVLLSGVSESGVYDALSRLLGDEGLYASMSSAENPYGDGHTSERIADILDDYFRSGMKR